MYPNISFNNGEIYLDETRLGTVTTGQLSTTEDVEPLDDESPWATSFSTKPFEFEMTSEINQSTLDILVGTPAADSFTFTYEGTCLEQIRRHKKKRINKKWAKRYGYRAVPCTYQADNAKLSDSNDGTIEFRTDTLKVIKRR
jgi:hypothetical protein